MDHGTRALFGLKHHGEFLTSMDCIEPPQNGMSCATSCRPGPTQNVMYLRHCYIALAVICLFPARSIGQSPPPNDNFANRTLLAGSSLSVAGTLAGATLESAEINGSVPPGAQTSGGSVWWTW